MKKRAIIAILFAILLPSCTHYYYVSNVQNIPMFTEKDEYRISGTIGGGDESSCIEFQSAYSPTDQIGVMANFMYATGGNESDNDGFAEGSYLEGAVGYFKPLGNGGVFEVYGGLGGGSQHHQYTSYNYDYGSQNVGYADLSLVRLFVQPSVGLSYHIFDVALSTRICSLDYTKVENHVSNEYSDFSDISSKTHYLLEPAITLRAGWKTVKLQFQASYVTYLNNPRMYFYEESHISIGVYVSLAGKNKKD
jgi:hypothetical protein